VVVTPGVLQLSPKITWANVLKYGPGFSYSWTRKDGGLIMKFHEGSFVKNA
jgi:hypothetical protein